MRLLKFISLLLLCATQGLLGQVTSDPAFPTGDEEIKITIDLKQAQDSRAAGLLGQSGGIYLWSGAGSDGTQGGAFEFEPPGQNNFNVAFEPGLMTSEGNDVWSITLTPRSYFQVPQGTPIRILGLLLKNTDGSAQTENFYLELSDGAFEVRFETPEESFLFAEQGETISINAVSSKSADLTLTIDDQGQPLQKATNATNLTYDLMASAGGKRTVTISATDGSSTVTDSFQYLVPATNQTAELPDDIQLGINYTSSSSVTLALQAPGKEFVYAIGEFNDWTPDPAYQMNVTPNGEIFWVELTNLTAGQEYQFQYLVDGELRIADPYADKVSIAGEFGDAEIIQQNRYQGLRPYPEGETDKEVSYLQTDQTPYEWQHDDYAKPTNGDLVIYELLVRDFDDQRTYEAVREKLGYIKSLGVNAIELMPIMEFDGNISWGYNPSFPFATDKYYGTKNELKRLIDEAHGMGMVVILDMVLNHAWGPNPLVRLYNEGDYGKPTNDNPWLNPDPKHPFNVGYDFNHESAYTKAYVDSVNHYWLNQYRFDGLRFDLSKGFTQVFTGEDVGAWNAYDASRVALLKRMYDQVRTHSPEAYVILEHLGTATEEKELADYGMMLWGNFNHQFREMAGGTSENFAWMSYQAREWQEPNVVAYMESHDEERLMWEALNFGATDGAVSLRQLEHAVDRIQMLTTFFLGMPGAKMLWQFGEFGYDLELNNDRTGIKPTRWDYQSNEHRARLLRLYQTLLALRNEHDAFGTEDFTMDLTDDLKRLILRDEDLDVFIVGNFGVGPLNTSLEFPYTGVWYDYYTGNEVEVTDVNQRFDIAMNQFHILTSKPLETPEAEISRFSIGEEPVVTSFEQPFEKVEISLYPSPTTGELVIDLGQSFLSGFELTITDMSGRSIPYASLNLLEGNRYSTKIETNSTGIFIVKVHSADEIAIRKVLKRQ